MAEPTTQIPDLVKVSDVEAHWNFDRDELRKLWRSQEGAPTLVKLKNGVYMVSIAEIVAWQKRRSLMTYEERRKHLRVIRQAAGCGDARRPPVLLPDRSRGTSA